MKRARFSDEQIVQILQEADRNPIAEVAKHHGVSEPSIYSWRKKFVDLGTDDVKCLKQLEQENGRLKKILAERDLEIEVMKEIAVKKW
jgi:putative transposase